MHMFLFGAYGLWLPTYTPAPHLQHSSQKVTLCRAPRALPCHDFMAYPEGRNVDDSVVFLCLEASDLLLEPMCSTWELQQELVPYVLSHSLQNDLFLKLPKAERQAQVKILTQRILSGETGHPNGESSADEGTASPSTPRDPMADALSPARFWAHLRSKKLMKAHGIRATAASPSWGRTYREGSQACSGLFAVSGGFPATSGLLLGTCLAIPRRAWLRWRVCRHARRRRRSRFADATKEDSIPSTDPEEQEELPEPIFVFWDLDNKKLPPDVSLATAVVALQERFLRACPQAVHLYASYKTVKFLGRHDYDILQSALASAWSQDLQDFLEAFTEKAPHGVRLKLVQDGAEVQRPASVTITPAQPQAADCLLVRDLLRLVAPISAETSCGTVCIISDDSDFAKVILDVHHSGWKVAVASQPNSWTLRRRSDFWMDWTDFHASLPGAVCTEDRGYCLSEMESLQGNVDISAHAVANGDNRVRRDINRDQRGHKR
ncbi:unnamed protein product [Symbiodinium sp. CCMP2592]|nr:unnamed protein product [Symbiodinium sp. CCMP2592]